MPFLRQLATVLPALCLFLGFEALFLAPVILIPAISGMLLLLAATHAFFGGRRPLTAEVWQCFVPPATLVLASATFFFLTERSALHHVLAAIVALLVGAIHRNLYLFLYQPFRYPPNALLHLSVVTDLLAAFFGAVGLFGLRLFLGLPAWALVALTASGSLLLLEQAFWASKIPFRKNAPYAAALALLFAELAAALMGLPVTHVISGAVVAVTFYVLFGVTRAALTGELTKVLAHRYAATAATGAGLLLATSLLAGVCGAAAAFLFLLPATPPELPERIPVPVRRTGIEIPRVPVVTVGLTGAKSLRAVPGGSAVADADVLASATVLTSDGWLVTDTSVFAAIVDPRALLPDGTALAPTEIIRDEGTGLTYVHVDTRGLDVVVFGDSATLPAGTTLFRASANRTLVPVGLETAHRRLRAEPRDVVRDSSAVAERLVLSPSAPRPAAGAGLITAQGALVGIAVAAGKGPVESAVPIEVVARALRDIVRSGAIERPSLGITTVDLSELAVRDDDLAGAFGALVSGVERSGPAAGTLQIGDRITAAGGEALDGSRLLSEILSSYRIGERIPLTFVREGEERSASLTVGAVTVPKL